MAAERDIEKNEAQGNILFDESGSMLLYSTMLGVKIVNINNGKVVQTIGKQENLRLLKIALYQVRYKILVVPKHLLNLNNISGQAQEK
jgi:peptidylprolyl isomerase domain and WD repeat-containing protein 1